MNPTSGSQLSGTGLVAGLVASSTPRQTVEISIKEVTNGFVVSQNMRWPFATHIAKTVEEVIESVKTLIA